MSTSSIGRDEIRKPLLDAYLLERRILLGCSSFVAVALIIWIVAISTDRWSVISGEGGKFMILCKFLLTRMCTYITNVMSKRSRSARWTFST